MVEMFLTDIEQLLELRRSIDAPLFSEGDRVYIMYNDTKYYYTFKNIEEKDVFFSKYNNYLNTPITRIPLRICTNDITDNRYIFHIPYVQYIKQHFDKLELSIIDCDIDRLKKDLVVTIKLTTFSKGKIVNTIDLSTLYYDGYKVDKLLGSVLYYNIDLTLEPYIGSWIDVDCLNLSKYSFRVCLIGKGVTTF